jgi:hypothetical protein
MKILFNVVKSGTGNNGGSQTIIRMALALRKIGHECFILSHMRNNFTWFKVPEDLTIIVDTDPKTWPECDAIIATACTTWKSTRVYDKTDNKLYWIRGHETWMRSEADLTAGYRSGLKLLVNSEWLKKYIETTCMVPCSIQYAGIPFPQLEYAALTCDDISRNMFSIGCLYQEKPTKHWDHFIHVMDYFGRDIAYFGFGLTKPPTSSQTARLPFSYTINPSLLAKFSIFKACDVWFAPTELEGLHIVPTEAAMAGCALVCNGAERSGMGDYAVHGMSALTYDTLAEATAHIERLIDDASKREELNRNLVDILKYKIGSVEGNARKLVKLCS